MHISLVIPTFNRERLLPRTIPALLAQRTEGFTYEIIFVINGSTDSSEQILADAAERNPSRLRYFKLPPTGGPSAPRNRGIQEAKGEIVIVLDDDVLPDPELLLGHARFHARNPDLNFAAIGELYVPPECKDDPMSLFHDFPYQEFRDVERLEYFYFWTCNVSVKRAFMMQHGMFDERFLGYEDMICGYKLRQAGMELRFVPEARGQHLHQLRADGVAAKGIWYGRWLCALIDHLPQPELMARFGILSPQIGWLLLAKRLIKRLGFHLINNPLTRAALVLAGATAGRRTKLSDLYYYLIFRGHLLKGYSQASEDARTLGKNALLHFPGSHAGQGDMINPSGPS